MNKKAVDSIFSLFGAAILIALIIAFFSIFALLLLAAKGSSDANFAVSDSNLNLNMIAFLQRNDTSEMKNWEVISSGDVFSLKPSAERFIRNPNNKFKGIYAVVLDRDKNLTEWINKEPYSSEDEKRNRVLFEDYIKCDKTNSVISEIYIPRLNDMPKKLVVCAE